MTVFRLAPGPLVSVSMALLLVASACGSDTDGATTSDDAGTEAASDSSTTTAANFTTSADSSTTTADGSTTTADGSTSTTTTATVDSSTEAGDGSAADTTVGVEAAQWADNVEITFGDGTFTFKSDSLPSHELPDQFLIPQGQPGAANPSFEATDTDSLLSPVDLEVEITLNPVYSEEVTDNPLGQIGVLISGAQLFNDFENMERSIVAIDDQTVIDGVAFLDSCNGHPLASGADYHYHGIPYCITDDIDIAGQHSTILGVLRDGFPVYANRDVDGSTLTSADLDECSGHFGVTPEFPDGIYHYHLTDDAAPYSINCYHGVVDDSVTQGGAGGDGGPPGGGGDAGPPADGEGAAAAPGQGGPDLSEAAATLGVTVEALEAAIGRPPFDFDAAAAILGVTAAELEAAVPAPPDNGGGPPPANG